MFVVMTGPAAAVFPDVLFDVAGKSGAYSYTTILPLAQKEEVKVTINTFMYFGDTKRCIPCKEQEKVFTFMAASGWRIGTEKNSHIIKVLPTEFNSYSIKSIPTFIYFKDGIEQRRVEGFMSAEQLAGFYNDNIKNK